MTEAVEIYVPKPGTVPWQVLTHVLANPEAVLMRKDVATLTGCPQNSVDAMLQLAVARACLMRRRNSALEMVWCLGVKANFQLEKMPDGAAQVALQAAPPPLAAAPVAAPVDDHAAASNVEPEAEPRVKRTYTRRVRAGADHRQDVPQPEDGAETPGLQSAGETCGSNPDTWAKGRITVVDVTPTVAMPLALTPELIQAVKTDPSTSFADKADGHHAIGWLTDAYAVMVKAQQELPAAQ